MRTVQSFAGETDPIDVLRRLVALLYREIGVLEPYNHGAVAEKRRMDVGFFSVDRKAMAKCIYQCTKDDEDPTSTERHLEKLTGLSVDNIEKAFAEGHWNNSQGTVSYGGPLWAKTARVTRDLRAAILSESEAEARRIANEQVPKLRHNTNNGYVIDKFCQLGPR